MRHQCGRGWRRAAFVAAVLLVRPALAADSYTMDPTHCLPVFEFRHLDVTTQTGRFDRASGSIVLDRAARTGSVNYEVESTSLNMGVGTETPDSPGFQLFEVTRFPKIVFRSERLTFDAAGDVTGAEGEVTLLGVSRHLSVTVAHFHCAVNPMNGKMMCAGDVTARLKRSEFGMVRYIPGISDEITINVPIEAYRD
jgi:polyisoprenoid-binding protein YceI